jgi:ABC-type nitrate/sulfonate/bicarbonate transport system substrate-binding protein
MRGMSLKLFAGLLGALSAAFMGFGPVSVQAAELKKVSVVAVAPTSLFWPLYIADGTGLYHDKGLEVSTSFSGSAAGPMQLLIAGEADFAVTTSDIGIEAAARGAKIRLIGGYLSSRPFVMMAKPGIKTVADLKGKSVGVSPPRDLSSLAFRKWMKSQGIKEGEVDLIFNSDTSSRYAALVNGATYAAMLSPPVSFKAEKDGFTPLLDFGEYMRGLPFLSIFAREDWLEKNGDVARAFLATQATAVDWFYDESNREKAIDILAKRVKMERPLIVETYDYYIKKLKPFSRKLDVSKEGLAQEVDDLVSTGALKSPSLVPASLNDTRFR